MSSTDFTFISKTKPTSTYTRLAGKCWISTEEDATNRRYRYIVTITTGIYRNSSAWTVSSSEGGVGMWDTSYKSYAYVDGTNISGAGWSSDVKCVNGTYLPAYSYVSVNDRGTYYSGWFSYGQDGKGAEHTISVSCDGWGTLDTDLGKTSTKLVPGNIGPDHTNPSLANAIVNAYEIKPYAISYHISGINYGTQYSLISKTLSVSYNLDDKSVSYNINAGTTSDTSYSTIIDGKTLSSSIPWDSVPDGTDVTLTFTVTTSGSGWTSSATKVSTCSTSKAYQAILIEGTNEISAKMFGYYNVDERIVNNSRLAEKISILGTTRLGFCLNSNKLCIYKLDYPYTVLENFSTVASAVSALESSYGIYVNEDKLNDLKNNSLSSIVYPIFVLYLGEGTYTECDMLISNKAGEKPSISIRRIQSING